MAAVLHKLGRGEEIAKRYPEQQAAAMLAQMLDRGVNCPPSSSLGRWFDAAAGLPRRAAGDQLRGQAAMLLEGLAERYGEMLPLDHGWRIAGDLLDLTRC